jgi:DNA-binding MarR family transcriptional regulator/ribosomal protein S18 acetylase RimI-like enzyme
MESLPRSAGGAAAGVAAVRRFNRFYTRRIGVLNEALLGSGFSLAQVRVLWELAHQDDLTASSLGDALALDAGYLSRVLAGFRARGFVSSSASSRDARVRHLRLTPRGRKALAPLERRAAGEVRRMLSRLAPGGRARLVGAMAAIESLLGEPAGGVQSFVLRDPAPGDFGWIVERHGALYALEHGWDASFEALVAGIVGRFMEACKPGRERAWIAERDGERLGCVLLVERSPRVAQLGLLLVDPAGRGMGVGSALVEQCIRFARGAGYRRLMLWTQSSLAAARRIYAAKGLRKMREERHRSFGRDLLGEDWQLDL